MTVETIGVVVAVVWSVCLLWFAARCLEDVLANATRAGDPLPADSYPPDVERAIREALTVASDDSQLGQTENGWASA